MTPSRSTEHGDHHGRAHHARVTEGETGLDHATTVIAVEELLGDLEYGDSCPSPKFHPPDLAAIRGPWAGSASSIKRSNSSWDRLRIRLRDQPLPAGRVLAKHNRKMDQPLRVYLVDDDLASFNLVLDVLGHAPWVRVVGGTSNPEVALREIPELAVDAIFLDVELSGMNGFELLERLPVKPAIVIVAKPEPTYALKAFRV